MKKVSFFIIISIFLVFSFGMSCALKDNDDNTKAPDSFEEVNEPQSAEVYVIEGSPDNIINVEKSENNSLLIRTIGADTSEVGSQLTENGNYALYPSHMKETNIENENQYKWSDRSVTIYFPQIYFSNEYMQYDSEIEKSINQELFMGSIGNEDSFLLTRDIRGLVEYNMDYMITKADDEIFSIKYWGDLYSVDHQHRMCSGRTIDVKTGEKINLSEFMALDEDLLKQVEKGEILYEDEVEYETEFVITCIKSFINNFNDGIEDAYSCYYLEKNTINLIIPMYQGNANYIILKIPFEHVS